MKINKIDSLRFCAFVLAKRKAFFYFLLISLFMYSCNETSEKPANFNDISQREDSKYIEKKKTKDTLKSAKPEESIFLQTFDSIYPEANWQKWDTLLFIDRFRPKKTEKWILTNEKDSLNLSFYEFKDSIQTRNAFFNWLDCFGSKKKSLEIGSNIQLKGRSVQILVNSTNILVVESIRALNQEKLIKSLNSNNKEINYFYLIDAPIRKKTTWSKMNKGTIEKLERNDKIP